MPRLSAITARFFTMMLVIIGTIFLSFYWYSVPLIKDKVLEIEHNASKIALNNIYALATKMYFDGEDYRQQALNSHQQRLQSIVSLSEDYIHSLYSVLKKQGLSEEQIWKTIFIELRSFRADEETYVWVADYDYRLLSHPADSHFGRDAASIRDNDGKLIVPTVVKLAIDEGEGFYHYKWPKLGQSEALDKYSYVRHFPQWGIVIGSGVYLDKIEQEVSAKKQKALSELRQAFDQITIANNGYLFVFDPNANMLIHPNPNIDGSNFSELLNPVTGNPIVKDLINASDTDKEAFYQWDSPDDPGNYVYDKLSLVRHIPGFDWYISSSVYVDDLQSSSELLSTRILVIAAISLLLASLLAWVFANWLTAPIRRLSYTAALVSKGQLSAKSGIQRTDELGVLAESFDSMVDQLSSNIQTLDSRVKARTQQLEASNSELLRAFDELQAARDELEISETRQRMILDALPAQVAYINNRNEFVFVNRGYVEMFGLDKASVVGRSAAEILGPQMYAEVEAYIQLALAGQQSTFEHHLQRDGQAIITRRTLLPFYDSEEQVSGFLSLSIDITDQKQAEERLAEANRMHAVGQMSGGLAHDFNNLLTIILGNLLELQDKTELPTLNIQHLQPAIRATRRGADITRRLLAFSRQQPLTPSVVSCQQLIAELKLLLTPSLPDSIVFSTQAAPNSPLIFVDPGQFDDALVNLALNSRDAMPQGGQLKIKAERIKLLDKQLYDEPVPRGEYACFSISDDGQGFGEDVLVRAFEPFFTTKHNGAGSGLGLSMVYGFVKQSSGFIRIISQPGAGAQVQILLPVAQALRVDEITAEAPPDSQPSITDNRLVLLVEDNADVRAVVRGQLVAMGFVVVEAGGGDEAVALLDTITGLGGLVTDVVLPGGANGVQIAKHAQMMHKDAFIVTMTGYSEAFAEQGSDFTLMQKPFDKPVLRQAISAAQSRLKSEIEGVDR
ncbi:MAG: cache domain-containing protein [Halopseudomonas sp.]